MSTLFGVDLFGNQIEDRGHCKLADDFIMPPFSVLSARDGAWQDRKRRWLSLGIKSELGRGENTLGLSAQAEEYRTRTGNYADPSPGGSPRPAMDYSKRERGDGSGKPLKDPARCFGQDLMRGEHTVGQRLTWVPGERAESELDEVSRKILAANASSGTSIFDPVLCELAYRWFSPEGGQVVDPFAGGSVRGIVASILGRRYWGGELRAEQVEANRVQGADICAEPMPFWECGDSMETLETAPEADFIFSCPPYGDLEQYSNDPRDISTMEYHAFMGAYRRIILRACGRLKQDRFACFVVGDFRDENGHYRNFVSDTIESFRQCGLALYNEAMLAKPPTLAGR